MTSLTALDKRWRLLVQGAVPRKHRRYLTWLMLLRWCLRLGNRVDFLPHTEALLAFYRSIDAVVSNSRAESFHMSIAEGMACGCWPVIRDWEGARELYPASQIFSGRGRMIELIRRYERMSPVEREAATLEMRAFVEQRYSIPVVGERISAALAAL
jgi:glycosyltransferase involved in cell wall biosynthesis